MISSGVFYLIKKCCIAEFELILGALEFGEVKQKMHLKAFSVKKL